jgi:hypothetical protein
MKIISGGAAGADNVFATQALNKGIDVDIHSFEGHNVRVPYSKKSPNIIVHTDEELITASSYVREASRILSRKMHSSGYKRNLMCRNFYQIKETDCVIAVSYLDLSSNTVRGGTGWAVQMALTKNIPVFLFDMLANVWLTSFGKNKIMSVWHKPRLTDYNLITGIGSRDLTPRGVEEIKSLFGGL